MDRYIPGNRYRPMRQDAPRTSNHDTSLPKNFEKPLTCFFWHQNGRCNRRDEDCAYAHWNTGHFAGALITIPGLVTIGAVAGKNARDLNAAVTSPETSIIAADMHIREERLRTWEQELKQWERRLKEEEEDLIKATKARTIGLRLRQRRDTRQDTRRDRALRDPDRTTSLDCKRPSSGS